MFNLHFMKVGTENDNNFGYEKITIVVDNIPLSHLREKSSKPVFTKCVESCTCVLLLLVDTCHISNVSCQFSDLHVHKLYIWCRLEFNMAAMITNNTFWLTEISNIFISQKHMIKWTIGGCLKNWINGDATYPLIKVWFGKQYTNNYFFLALL